MGMLGPKFTIRLPLAVMTFTGLLCLVSVFAGRGHSWAVAVLTTIFTVVLGFLVYAMFFVITWIFSCVVGQFETKQPRSPFAQHRPPPQIVPPDEPL